MVIKLKKLNNMKLLLASAITTLIFAYICSYNYRNWECDIPVILLLLISISIFLYTSNKELYRCLETKIDHKIKDETKQWLLAFKDKQHLSKQLNWETYLIFLATLLQILPVLLYEIIAYSVLYKHGYDSFAHNLNVYGLSWVFYFILLFAPLLWVLSSFYHYGKCKLVFEMNQLNELMNLALTDLGACENPYKTTHPYYQIAETMLKVSEAKAKAVEEGLRNERTKVELITNISHDLKTPLTAITNYLELLSKEPLSQPSKDYVEVITTKVRKLSDMITSVFELSKTASGVTQLNLVPMDMNCLIEQVQGDLSEEIETYQSILRLNLSNEPTTFLGDSTSLYRVLQNLVGNAIKYSLKGTRIFIHTEATSNLVKLTILNTSNYEMKFEEANILERFTRGDVSRTTEGNGLGLAIAKTYTEACGGQFEIRVEGDQFRASIQFPRE